MINLVKWKISMSFGLPEIILILLAVIILFGGKKIPELVRGLGKSLSEFKKGKNEPAEPENVDEK